MSKLSSLTEDKYTLNDIFTRHYQFWLAMPLVCYLLVDFIHVVVFTFTKRDATTLEELSILLVRGEFAGDYFVSLIKLALVLGLFFEIIGIISLRSAVKDGIFNSLREDYVPITFFTIFVVLMVVSECVNGGILFDNFVGNTSLGEGMLSLVSYFLMYYLCASFIKGENVKFNLMYLFLGVGLTVGILTFVDRFIRPISILSYSGLSGIYYNSNYYAYFLTMQIMLSASLFLFDRVKFNKAFALFMFLFGTFLLSVNNTLGCFLACLVAFAFLIVGASIKNKKFSIGALLMFVAFLAINFVAGFFFENFFSQIIGLFFDVKMIVTDDENAYAAGTYRWNLWTHTMGYVKEKPWLGYGFHGIENRLYEETGNANPHNEYLYYLAEYGIFAALAYIAGLVAIYVKALIKRANVDNATFCCLVAAFGYIGSAFFGLTVVYVTPFFFILLGLANSTSSTANEAVEAEIENSLVGDAAEGKETEPDAIPENEEELSETAVRN